MPFIAPADLKAVTYHVGGDPCADGNVAGEFFVKTAAGKPFKLLELQGVLANDNGIRRSKCLDEAVKAAPNIKIVAQLPTPTGTHRRRSKGPRTRWRPTRIWRAFITLERPLQGIFSVRLGGGWRVQRDLPVLTRQAETNKALLH